MSDAAATPPQEPAPDDGLGTIYWVIAAFLVVLVVIGLITYSGEKETAAAEAKAQELIVALEQAGLPAPENPEVFVRTLGDDGGYVCDDAASALGRAALLDRLVNGASFVGVRPVIVDRDLIAGEAAILATYCPEELEEFTDKFGDLELDDVIRD